jgi:hypothetical protein
MDEEWLTEQIMAIRESQIRTEVSLRGHVKYNHREHEEIKRRLKAVERKNDGGISTKKLVGLVTAVSMLMTSIATTIVYFLHNAR